MSVWLTIPSAAAESKAQDCVNAWQRMGYRVALWRDQIDGVVCDLKLVGPYPGYAAACNALVREVIYRDSAAQWMICAGDDIRPDQTKQADEIADDCEAYFASMHADREDKSGGKVAECSVSFWEKMSTFGVMQPTGDRWGEDPSLPNLHPMRTAYVDRVAGSAWYGREYCARMYGGTGPLYEGYRHMFVDQESRDVAVKMGVYWERRDLAQVHQHWQRVGGRMPQYLDYVSSPEHWRDAQALYTARKAAGFPGHLPECEAEVMIDTTKASQYIRQ